MLGSATIPKNASGTYLLHWLKLPVMHMKGFASIRNEKRTFLSSGGVGKSFLARLEIGL